MTDEKTTKWIELVFTLLDTGSLVAGLGCLWVGFELHGAQVAGIGFVAWYLRPAQLLGAIDAQSK